jgi:hypothetical protein
VKTLDAILAIARADFLERVRRYSYLVTLLFAVYLGYAAATGRILIKLGDYRGLYTSAWIGSMMALVTTLFVSLVGFYVVKNAIDRDRQTRVGDILAATPLSKFSYLLGKFLSNFAVLASMVLVLALAAFAMQFFAAEDRSFHLWALFSPFLLVALPTMALTAALALLFETVRYLRGGFGNVLWFFIWSFGLSLPEAIHHREIDPLGFWVVTQSMMTAARAGIPGYKDSFELTVANASTKIATGFHWNGVDWSAPLLLMRFLWIAVAIVITLFGALFFDRFDPAKSRGFLGRKSKQKKSTRDAAGAQELLQTQQTQPRTAAPTHLTPIASTARHGSFLRLVAAELRLALKGFGWWWYAAAAGLLVAQFTAPLAASRGPILSVAWIWPALIWSALGTRESRFGTGQLVFSCPQILSRQLPAAWIAAALVATITGLGAAIRLALAGQRDGLLAWGAGVIFIASLALALGVWSGTSKTFEGLYTTLWYLGPLNHAPGMDFTGSTDGAFTLRYSIIYLAISAVLVVLAFFRRARQLGHN